MKKDKDILKHELVPEHIILSDSDKKKVLIDLGCNQNQLPKIKITDPVVEVIGAEEGDVLQITRKSVTAGTFITYRLVEGDGAALVNKKIKEDKKAKETINKKVDKEDKKVLKEESNLQNEKELYFLNKEKLLPTKLNKTYYLDEYKPKNQGEQDEISESILKLKNKDAEAEDFFVEKIFSAINIDKLKDFDYNFTFCSVPGSKVTKELSGIDNVIEKLVIKIREHLPNNKISNFKGVNYLYRNVGVEESSTSNDKSKEKHLDSIKLKYKNRIKNNVVFLIDDVIITGNTMDACRDIILESEPFDVICIGLTKTKQYKPANI